jgi:hypothetical protein
MFKYLKQFGWHWVIIGLGVFFFITGMIGIFYEPFQFVFKKVFLVCLWYSLSYIMRKLRIGGIDWSDEKDKKIYYYILLIGSAIIFAFS